MDLVLFVIVMRLYAYLYNFYVNYVYCDDCSVWRTFLLNYLENVIVQMSWKCRSVECMRIWVCNNTVFWIKLWMVEEWIWRWICILINRRNKIFLLVTLYQVSKRGWKIETNLKLENQWRSEATAVGGPKIIFGRPIMAFPNRHYIAVVIVGGS